MIFLKGNYKIHENSSWSLRTGDYLRRQAWSRDPSPRLTLDLVGAGLVVAQWMVEKFSGLNRPEVVCSH
jgi:hypothetical protein